MRKLASSYPFIALTATAVALAVTIGTRAAGAEEKQDTSRSGCACPQSGQSPRAKLAALPPPLDVDDEIAALESVQIALSKVADGSSYVWHRSHGRLSGVVRPTSSFKDTKGQVCRHITVVLNTQDETRRTETTACRLNTGIWQLEG